MGLGGNVVMEVIHVIVEKKLYCFLQRQKDNVKKTCPFNIIEQNMYMRSVDHNLLSLTKK